MSGKKAPNRSPVFDVRTPIDPDTARTVRRVERLRRAIELRQPDLHVVLENVHDRHNVAAVLRTCDAVGVGTVHLVYTYEKFPKYFSTQTSAGVQKWTDLIRHDSIEECYDALRREGCRIWATHLSERAVDLYELDMVGPVALVFGNEHRGLSEEACRLADGNFTVPMVGLAQSLNISVACAVTLYEAMRQRRLAGCYDPSAVPEERVEAMLREWTQK